jgi:hypothetical protein
MVLAFVFARWSDKQTATSTVYLSSTGAEESLTIEICLCLCALREEGLCRIRDFCEGDFFFFHKRTLDNCLKNAFAVESNENEAEQLTLVPPRESCVV